MIVSTIASHSSLQILLGAKKEGFKTRLYVSPKKALLLFTSDC